MRSTFLSETSVPPGLIADIVAKSPHKLYTIALTEAEEQACASESDGARIIYDLAAACPNRLCEWKVE